MNQYIYIYTYTHVNKSRTIYPPIHLSSERMQKSFPDVAATVSQFAFFLPMHFDAYACARKQPNGEKKKYFLWNIHPSIYLAKGCKHCFRCCSNYQSVCVSFADAFWCIRMCPEETKRWEKGCFLWNALVVFLSHVSNSCHTRSWKHVVVREQF